MYMVVFALLGGAAYHYFGGGSTRETVELMIAACVIYLLDRIESRAADIRLLLGEISNPTRRPPLGSLEHGIMAEHRDKERWAAEARSTMRNGERMKGNADAGEQTSEVG
jgi:hypothetical protein